MVMRTDGVPNNMSYKQFEKFMTKNKKRVERELSMPIEIWTKGWLYRIFFRLKKRMRLN
jgi:hypothetical protein